MKKNLSNNYLTSFLYRYLKRLKIYWVKKKLKEFVADFKEHAGEQLKTCFQMNLHYGLWVSFHTSCFSKFKTVWFPPPCTNPTLQLEILCGAAWASI